jgi:Tfp pilus assembly protein PilX
MLRLVRCERGMSLPLVIGTIMALTIMVLGIVQYTAANSRNAGLSSARQDSRGIAEGGLNRAAAILASNPTSSSALPACPPATPPVGEARWCGTYDGTTKTWTVRSTGRAWNPTGPGAAPQAHTVTAQFTVTMDAGAWEYVYIEPLAGQCMLVKNEIVLHSPLYVKGNLCLDDNARYAGPRLWVTGTVETKSNASVGTSSARIPRVSVRDNAPAASGCRYGTSGSFQLPCTTAHKVFTDEFNTVVDEVQRPPADFPYYYANSKPGPLNGCTVYSGAINHPTSFFDSNTTRNNSNGDRDLMPSGESYNCERWEGGVLVGKIAWNHSTRVFTITAGVGQPEPTIFFDGKVLLNNVGNILVQGRGVIYVNDIYKQSTGVRVCAVVVSCQETTWNPSTDTWNPNNPAHGRLFMIVGNTSATSIEIENGARYQGALYTMGGLLVKSGSPGAQVQGPIIALGALIENGADLRPWPWFVDMPPGAPSYGTPHLAFKSGSWRG